MTESKAQAHARVVQEFLGALFERNELRRDLVTDGVVWHMGGRNQTSGDYRGPEGVERLFSKMIEVAGSPTAPAPDVEHALELHDMLASDDHVVVLWRRTGHRGGVIFDSPGVGVYNFDGGKISEIWVYHWDQPAADAYFGSA